MCKISNGIIGITRNDTARDRFCITWSERSHITEDTKTLYGLEDSEHKAISTRKEGLPSRMAQDKEKVLQLVNLFSRFNIFGIDKLVAPEQTQEDEPQTEQQENFAKLIAITTNDVATDDIAHDLLGANKLGRKLVEKYVITNY